MQHVMVCVFWPRLHPKYRQETTPTGVTFETPPPPCLAVSPTTHISCQPTVTMQHHHPHGTLATARMVSSTTAARYARTFFFCKQKKDDSTPPRIMLALSFFYNFGLTAAGPQFLVESQQTVQQSHWTVPVGT
mmetsp:Transcript_20852/g.48158  ORF Transcript_20852/g.48158 Transcript_20852/m.48158 type:complete len:133 (-) Transcript_20852:997-1395(-)